MPRYDRPAVGACDAMASSYGQPAPCTRRALWSICGKNLCERHAQIVALKGAESMGIAKRIVPPRGQLQYVEKGASNG